MSINLLAAKNREQQLIGLLRKISLFQRLNSRFLQGWLKGAKTRQLKEGERLCGKGETDTSLFILLKGALERDEGMCGIRVWNPITSVGETEALIGQPHSGTIIAREATLLLEIPRRHFLLVLIQDAGTCQRVCRNLIDMLSAQMVEANTRNEALNRRRTEIAEAVKHAEIELNDLRMLQSLRA